MSSQLSHLVAPWKSKLQQSLAANKDLPYSKYAQLATVRPDGRPANRTIVFRGFLNDSNDLTFITDSRTRKVGEVSANPAAELCWYFPTSREQYRLSGLLTIVDGGHSDKALLKARLATWSNLSNNARSQFTWPQPGLPRDPDNEGFKNPAPGPEEQPPSVFSLVVFKVDHVDLVNLFTNQRSIFTVTNTPGTPPAWHEKEVNP